LLDSKSLRWHLHDRPAIEITRGADGRFQLSEPIVDLAAAGYVKSIIDAWDTAQMQASKLADDEAGRQQAGLVPPAAVVKATFADGERIVEIGGVGPLADKETRYVRVDGRILVTSNAPYESLRVGLDDLRERLVFQHAFAQATDVTIEEELPGGKRETLRLQLAAGSWRLVQPIVGRADPVAAQRFLTALLSLRVTEFLPGAVRLPAGDPSIVIAVVGDFGREELKVWRQAGQIWGMLPGRNIGFISDNREYSLVFEQTADELRARILLPLGINLLEDLLDVVVDPGQGRGDRLRLTREHGGPWQVQEPVHRNAAPTPCNELAEAMSRLVVREFVDADGVRPRAEDPRYGLLPAQRWTVVAQGHGETAPTTLWFGEVVMRGEEALIHCCRADEPDTIVLVPRDWAEKLRRPWLLYCDRLVLRQTAPVERLELQRAADGAARRFTLTDGAWRREGEPLPRPEVGELANEYLSDLVGDKAVDARGEQFRQPDFVVSLQRRNGDQLAQLRFFDRGADLPLCVQPEAGGDLAFEVKALLSQQLRALWQ
jgi:hypothetical protein